MSIRSNVDPRKLDQRIVVQSRELTQGSNGNVTVSWSTVVECWAAVDAQTAKDSMEEPRDAMARRTGSQFTIWIRADVKARFLIVPDMRVMWRDVAYNIVDVPDQQLRGRMTALLVEGGVAEDGQ